MTAGSSSRIVSLDQFRGYTVLGMFLVNFIGHFDVITTYAPVLKHHNTYCSYADTIMPHFLFAVGAAYRLTLRRRLAHGDGASAYFRVVRRNLGLILLGVVIYHLDVTMFRLPDGSAKPWARLVDDFHQFGWWAFVKSAFEREPFQTLVHIGVPRSGSYRSSRSGQAFALRSSCSRLPCISICRRRFIMIGYGTGRVSTAVRLVF